MNCLATVLMSAMAEDYATIEGRRREAEEEEDEMRDAEGWNVEEAKIVKRSARARSTRRVPRGRVDILPRSVRTVIEISKMVCRSKRECEMEVSVPGYRLRLHFLFW